MKNSIPLVYGIIKSTLEKLSQEGRSSKNKDSLKNVESFLLLISIFASKMKKSIINQESAKLKGLMTQLRQNFGESKLILRYSSTIFTIILKSKTKIELYIFFSFLLCRMRWNAWIYGNKF